MAPRRRRSIQFQIVEHDLSNFVPAALTAEFIEYTIPGRNQESFDEDQTVPYALHQWSILPDFPAKDYIKSQTRV